MHMRCELTAIESPHLLASRTTMPGSEIAGTLTFTPEGDTQHSRMAWDWQVHTAGWTRLAAPLVWLLGHRMERRIWTGFKEQVEAI